MPLLVRSWTVRNAASGPLRDSVLDHLARSVTTFWTTWPALGQPGTPWPALGQPGTPWPAPGPRMTTWPASGPRMTTWPALGHRNGNLARSRTP